MTYLQFHLVFILPPLLALAWRVRGVVSVLGSRARWTLPVMALIALAWTTPWDNYLVYRGVWWYGPDRVLGTIGYVPVEEYLFFLLQPLLSGLWCYHVLMRTRPGAAVEADVDATAASLHDVPAPGLTRPTAEPRGLAVYGALTAAGLVMLLYERTLYLGLILAWAAPVLLGQWLLVGPELRVRARLFAYSIAVPTLYLWIADRVAIGVGIWSISPRYTTGLHLLGLPMEEAVFFLVTNLLVVQGVFLFLQPWRSAAAIRAAVAAA